MRGMRGEWVGVWCASARGLTLWLGVDEDAGGRRICVDMCGYVWIWDV